MPVPGNQESGVLFRHAGICVSDIPIKKRRFPFVPRDEGPPPVSDLKDTENERNDLFAVDSALTDSIMKLGAVENSIKDVKKGIDLDIIPIGVRSELKAPGSFHPIPSDVKNEIPFARRVNSVQSDLGLRRSLDKEIGPVVKSNSSDSLVSGLSTSHAVPNSDLRFPAVNVKREMVDIGSEGDYKHEHSTAFGNKKLTLTSNELVDSLLEKQQAKLSSDVPYRLVPPQLSLSSSNADLPQSICADKTVTDSNVIMTSTDRSHWVLNTTMDAWEGSTEETASHDVIGADELSSSRDTHETNQILSSPSALNVRLDKGKRVMEPLKERSTPSISSQSFPQTNVADSLLLSLSTSSPQDSSQVMPHSQTPIVNSISPAFRTVKSEPVDDNFKPGLSLVLGGTVKSLDKGLVYNNSAESYDKNLGGNFGKIIEPTSFKSEISHDSNQESHCTASFTLKRPSSNIVQLQESSSSSTVVSGSVTPQQYFVSNLTTFSELSGSVSDLDQSEHYSNITEKPFKDIMNSSITSQMPEMPESVDNYYKDPNASDDSKVNSSETTTFSVQRTDENNIKANNIAGESATEKEKIATMVEDDTYVSDHESDGNHPVVRQMGRGDGQYEKLDDDYEDGEVRDFQLKSLVRDPTCDRQFSENSKEVDDGCEMHASTNQSTINEKHNDIKLHDGTNDHNESIEAMSNGNCNQQVSDYISLLVTKPEQVASLPTEAKAPEKFLGQLVGEIIPGVKENVWMRHGQTRRNDVVLETVSVARNYNEKGSDMDRVPDSSFAKEDVTVDEHGSFNESALGGSRSRIINLPRASNSPSRFRSLSGNSFTPWSGRERYGDVDGNDSHYKGHRDDTFGEDFRKFSRDQPFRNSRMDFKNDRGRGTGRFSSVHNNRNPEHDFPTRSFDVSGSAGYRFNRHRRASVVANNGLRSNDFAVASGRTDPSAGKIGRKPFVNEFHSFRQPSSRRLSPGSRDGATMRNLPNSRRLPESSSDLSGVRHENFSRGSPDAITGSVYSRPQSSYNEKGGQFVNGNRDYTSVQRRFFPRARSKSPGSIQPRSPGTWPSSRRRFNDDFNNPSEQIQHKSPMYREERMRSPDRVCYTDEFCDRRPVSPNYVTRPANERRDSDFAREQGNLRSISSTRRSPSDRAFSRSTGRPDVLDSQELAENDEYFSGSTDSGRFHEYRSEGSNDEIKKFGGKRGQFRPSRPSYGRGNENYRLNAEYGSMPLRFCSDQDTESFERSCVRQRDFDGGSKNRPFIAQRQIRSTGDQEGNFGQSGQVWHDESFSDDSRMKKRRF